MSLTEHLDGRVRDGLTFCLSVEERARYSAMGAVPQRDAYLQSRALLRCALAPVVGVFDPADVVVRSGSGGRPETGGSHGSVRFSSARSLSICAVALSRAPVGIDVEDVRPLPLRVAERVLGPGEFRSMVAEGRDRWGPVFFDHWVVKEACAKVVGADAQPFWRVPSSAGASGRWRDVAWRRIDLGAGRSAAVAARGPSVPDVSIAETTPDELMSCHV